MDWLEAKQKLWKILDISPEFKKVLCARYPTKEKREKINEFLSQKYDANLEEDLKIHSLEWIITRDAVKMMRQIFSHRSANLSKFDFLNYLDVILGFKKANHLVCPSEGFLEEVKHLLLALEGKTKIYPAQKPAFLKYKGRMAAKLRSSDLTQLTKKVSSFTKRYLCGLSESIVQERLQNKKRILDFFHATQSDWDDWKWHIAHIIQSSEVIQKLIELSEEEKKSIELTAKNRIPFGITPYYLSLMDYKKGREKDYAIRAQVIPPLSYIDNVSQKNEQPQGCMDFMREADTSPIDGITRRYPMIVILKPFLTCPQICVYCQRNWQIHSVDSPEALLQPKKLQAALQWIQSEKTVTEVLVTGGDPLMLSDEQIGSILESLASISHIERIRIGTRTFVTMPQRMSDSLVKIISQYHVPGRREILMVTHFEHAYEITPESMQAVQKFRKCGIDVYNQLVYTFYNSRRFEACFLRNKLRLIGVNPYYTFNTKGKEETEEYRVPITRLLQEQKEEARVFPGSVRTDEVVFNVPGMGKNYLRASQHRDLITIFPDGRRMYEFHPWEKKISNVDTYLYTDVSIYDYLQRLVSSGEHPEDYKSIWYYY
ncbi:MAG: KamA family radical SAM protein [Candidatus Brocadiae bacterium]|nr:KamA family radical SAM protein [Candidatus Brocadiia bacterium]